MTQIITIARRWTRSWHQKPGTQGFMEMKRLISIFFVILYSAILLKPVVPIINYHIQLHEYKARCANIRKPDLECKGTCHLQSEIRQNSSESAPVVPITKSATEDPSLYFPVAAPAMVNISVDITHIFISPILHACRGFSGAVFHPPVEYA